MNNKNISFEPRQLNVSYQKSKSGSMSSRVIVPITWLRELGITEENRKITVKFDDDKITIRRFE